MRVDVHNKHLAQAERKSSTMMQKRQKRQVLDGTVLLAPHGNGSRKNALNKAGLTLTWLASRSQQASLPSGKKNNEKRGRQQASK